LNIQLQKTYFDLNDQLIASPTKNKIIDVSIELFSRHGFNGASIREITKEVGIKESSLYKHFANKHEILEVIFLNFSKETAKLLPPKEHIEYIIEVISFQDFLTRGIENFLQHIDDPIHQKIWRIMYIELFQHPVAQQIYIHEIMKQTVECLTFVFEGMVQRGKIRSINARILATQYQYASITLIMEYNLLKATDKSTEQIKQSIQEHVSFFSEMASI